MNRLVALGIGILLACGAGGPAPDPVGEPGTPATPGTPEPPAPSSGCEGQAAAPGVTNGSIEVAGVRRTFVLVLPSAAPAEPLPVYFVFHGMGGSGAQYRSWMRFESQAKTPAIFVYPDGLKDGQGSTGWPNTNGRDVAFFDALLAHVKTTACVDANRVFATGFSYGGIMSNTVGCARPAAVRAIAPLSGGLPWTVRCEKTPVAAFIAHGTGDETVALSSGEAARDQWRAANACGSETRSVTPAPCQSYQGCAAGHPVVWCAFDGGHEVPSWIYAGVMGFFESLP